MNKTLKYLGAGLTAAAGLAAWFYLSSPDKIPPAAFDAMTFSADFNQVVGDATGTVCHQIILRSGKAPDRAISSHFILGKNFAKMSLEEKKAVVREHTRKDMEDAGLACVGPDGRRFLSEAYAQKHNPGGGGCSTHSCSAKIVEGGGCELSGPNCVITVVCCYPNCPPGC